MTFFFHFFLTFPLGKFTKPQTVLAWNNSEMFSSTFLGKGHGLGRPDPGRQAALASRNPFCQQTFSNLSAIKERVSLGPDPFHILCSLSVLGIERRIAIYLSLSAICGLSM